VLGKRFHILFQIKRFDFKNRGVKLGEAPKPMGGMVQNERSELDEVFD
jgi:hypothetical protein